MTTLQDPPAAPDSVGRLAPRRESALRRLAAVERGVVRRLAQELTSFAAVGALGTATTFVVGNLARHLVSANAMTTVVIPMLISTVISYPLTRKVTFRHRDSDGSGREMALFVGVNVVGVLIQLACWDVRTSALNLHGTVSFNAALVVGTLLGSMFRYWSYKKWIFLPASV